MASADKLTFAELYRSAFAETEPHTKQALLQQVQSLIDTWHCEEQKVQEQKTQLGHAPVNEHSPRSARISP